MHLKGTETMPNWIEGVQGFLKKKFRSEKITEDGKPTKDLRIKTAAKRLSTKEREKKRKAKYRKAMGI